MTSVSFYFLIEPSGILLSQDLMNGRGGGSGIKVVKEYKLPFVRWIGSGM